MSQTEFTVRSGGNNLYAGTLDGVNEAAVTPLVTYTNGGWNQVSGVYTPASGNPVTAGVRVGYWVSLYPDGTTGTTVFHGIVTAVSAATITINLANGRSGIPPTAAGSGVTTVVGGAWSGPSGTTQFPFNFIANSAVNASSDPARVNLKNDQIYAVTAAMNHTNAGPVTFQGYTTTFGDGGSAVIDGGTTGASYVVLMMSGSGYNLSDLEIRNNGATGTADLLNMAGPRGLIRKIIAHGCRGAAISNTAILIMVEVEVYGANQANSINTGGIKLGSSATLVRPVVHNNTGSNGCGIMIVGGNTIQVTIIEPVVDSNGGLGIFTQATTSITVIGGSIHNNGGDNLLLSNNSSVSYIENVVTDLSGGYGINANSGNTVSVLRNNAYYQNTSGQVGTPSRANETGAVTLTTSPFIAPSTGDFRLNSAIGGGAACRGTGRGLFTQTASGYTGTVGYPDIGAAQHHDAFLSPRAIIANTWALIG